MLTAIFFMTMGICAIVAVGYLISGPRYKGPVTDHFDGQRFINLHGIRPQGLFAVFRWMINRRRGPWMKRTATFGEKPLLKVESGARITFVNHCTFLIQTNGVNLLTDPVWSERASPFSWAGPKRKRPPGIRFDDLPHIDIVLLSHNHYDHLDQATLERLHRKFNPRIFTPLGVKRFLDKKNIPGATEMDWWEELSLSEKMNLACVPAQHFSGRGFFDRDATLWCGFVIKAPCGNIHFVADTGYHNRLFKEIANRISTVDIAIIPIGAYKPSWFMSPIHASPEEAVSIHFDLGAKTSIASHFGTFPLADDGSEEPRQDLIKALDRSGVPREDFLILTEGNGMDFLRG